MDVVNSDIEEAFLTVSQVSDRLNISKHTVYRLVKRGRLDVYGLGVMRRYKKTDVDNLFVKIEQ